ncbi:MAG: hypothetical protein WA254_21225 [Candidatus Sulfotelmatobacter sp.]
MRGKRTLHATSAPATSKRAQIPTLKVLVAQITPENRYGEIATGPERGEETPRGERPPK